MAASIRHPQHCVMAAKAGAHISTVPYGVLMQMTKHPLTDAGGDAIYRRLAQGRKVNTTTSLYWLASEPLHGC